MDLIEKGRVVENGQSADMHARTMSCYCRQVYFGATVKYMVRRVLRPITDLKNCIIVVCLQQEWNKSIIII